MEEGNKEDASQRVARLNNSIHSSAIDQCAIRRLRDHPLAQTVTRATSSLRDQPVRAAADSGREFKAACRQKSQPAPEHQLGLIKRWPELAEG
jgi:hypothetical protein